MNRPFVDEIRRVTTDGGEWLLQRQFLNMHALPLSFSETRIAIAEE